MASILFDQPKAVMLRVPKTGSTSIVHGLFGGIGERDLIHHGPPPNSWMEYYRFCFVRNPYERMVSALEMFRSYPTETEQEKQLKSELNLSKLLDIAMDDSIPLDENRYLSKLRLHSIPMTHPFFGLELASDVFRFEEYETSYRQLGLKLGCEVEEIPHMRKSERGHYRSFFENRGLTDVADLKRAHELLAEDCSTFNYTY